MFLRAQGKGKSKKNYSLQFKSRLICLHRETIWKIEFEVLNSRLSIFAVLTGPKKVLEIIPEIH